MSNGREMEFVGVLGKGGFGTVYLANLHRDRFVRRVAVKVLKDASIDSGEQVARHRDEARLLGLLAHENIVQVLDLVDLEGRPAVIMEYVEGVDAWQLLGELAKQRASLSLRAVMEIVLATATALDAAWNLSSPQTGKQLRVIHRDIKPPNLLITTSGSVKVLDFGVARADFAREVVSGSRVFGTPRYMAPETWLGEDSTPAVDIYALGVTILDLVGLTNFERPPLQPIERYDAHIDKALAAIPDLRVRQLVRRCLAYVPADRPAASDLIEEIGMILQDLPGESLRRIAKKVVPEVLARRQKQLPDQPLPSRMSLDSFSALAPTAPGAPVVPLYPSSPPVGPSSASSSPPVTPTSQRFWVLPAVGAAISVLIGVGILGFSGLWLWRSGQLPGAAGPSDASTTDATPAEIGATEPVAAPPVATLPGATPPVEAPPVASTPVVTAPPAEVAPAPSTQPVSSTTTKKASPTPTTSATSPTPTPSAPTTAPTAAAAAPSTPSAPVEATYDLKVTPPTMSGYTITVDGVTLKGYPPTGKFPAGKRSVRVANTEREGSCVVNVQPGISNTYVASWSTDGVLKCSLRVQ